MCSRCCSLTAPPLGELGFVVVGTLCQRRWFVEVIGVDNTCWRVCICHSEFSCACCFACFTICIDGVLISLSGFIRVGPSNLIMRTMGLVVVRHVRGMFVFVLCWAGLCEIIWVARIFVRWYVGLVWVVRSYLLSG